MGEKPLPVKEYKLIIFCEFNHKQVGFLVKDMLDIVEKTIEELKNSEKQNAKITYTTYIKVGGKDQLCTVFNAEQLLVDIGWTDIGTTDLEKYVQHSVDNTKLILAAEDSAVVREVLIAFFKKSGAHYEVYPNGAELLDRLSVINPQSVGLVITDIKMPETDGYQVAQAIKENALLSHIPVVVNSSMTTSAVKHKMKSIGVDDFIGKTDIKSLYNVVVKYIGLT